MTSRRITIRLLATVCSLSIVAGLAAVSFAACLTPEIVDSQVDPVVMASPECMKCMAASDVPGPGCGDEVAACRESPSCIKSLDCALQRGCIGGAVQLLVACIPACTRVAGLGGAEDPGRISGIRTFECITHGACANVCFTDSDGGFFPIDAGDASIPEPDSGPDAGGACINAADQPLVADRTATNEAARTCGIECFQQPDMTCAAKCMRRVLGLSEPCAACWGDSIKCVSEHCLTPCFGGPDDPACIACSNQFCTPAFHACSGL